jgi:hypothetical protein
MLLHTLVRMGRLAGTFSFIVLIMFVYTVSSRLPRVSRYWSLDAETLPEKENLKLCAGRD